MIHIGYRPRTAAVCVLKSWCVDAISRESYSYILQITQIHHPNIHNQMSFVYRDSVLRPSVNTVKAVIIFRQSCIY